jgi:hypothetical protein
LSSQGTEPQVKKPSRLTTFSVVAFVVTIWLFVLLLNPFRGDFLANPRIFVFDQFGQLDFQNLIVFILGFGVTTVLAAVGARSLQRTSTIIVERTVPSRWWTNLIVNFSRNAVVKDPNATGESILLELEPMIPGLLSFQDKVKPDELLPSIGGTFNGAQPDGKLTRSQLMTLASRFDPKKYEVVVDFKEDIELAEGGKASFSVRSRTPAEVGSDEPQKPKDLMRNAARLLHPLDLPNMEALDAANKARLKDNKEAK